MIEHRYSQYEYRIFASSHETPFTIISRIHTDIHPDKRRSSDWKEMLRYNGVIHPYFKQRLTEKELLKKLKLFQVFS